LAETIRAKKSLGQHFLTDAAYCRRIADFAQAGPDDAVVEIGPGTGRLTRILLERSSRVVGIEVDPEMVQLLDRRFSDQRSNGTFSLIHADILRLNWAEVLDRIRSASTPGRSADQPPTVKVVGNLPYNIATRILTFMSRVQPRFHSLTVMTQKEVAQRILASSGGKEFGYLTLFSQFHFERSSGFDVPPGAFTPRPKVFSHVFQLIPVRRSCADYELFLHLIRTAFRHRRKTFWNNLTSVVSDRNRLAEAMDLAGIAPGARAEEISLEQFLYLTRVLSCAHA
jgi:16S rRNA (adenine1518-N6/adenine1519-N6)-dimethyltransferase